MTITAVGSLVSSTGVTTLAVNPTAAHDVLVLSAAFQATTSHVTSVSGGGVPSSGPGSWQRLILDNPGSSQGDAELWFGAVTTPGASTISVTTTAGFNKGLACQQFTAGTPAVWTQDGLGAAGNNTNFESSFYYPSVTPTGSHELYVGLVQTTNASVHSASGTGGPFTYQNFTTSNTSDSMFAYSPNVSLPTAQQPGWGVSGEAHFSTCSALLIATPSTTFFIQTAIGNTGSDSSVTVSLPSSTTPGNFLASAICLPTDVVVQSVTDSTNNRWIQNSNAFSDGGNCEIWSARGIQGGVASVTVTVTASSQLSNEYDATDVYDSFGTYDGAASIAASVSVNVSEWSGIWYRVPVDQWSQNYGTSASPTISTLQPRTSGDLVITAVSSSASVGAVPSGYTVLTEMGDPGYGAAYQVLSGSVATSGNWTASDGTWAVAACAFVPGEMQVNPLLQFPETSIEVCTLPDFMAPLRGAGVWTSLGQYVKQFDVQGIGRQHLLDRVNSTQTTFTLDNRSGAVNSWNQNSPYWNSGSGMKPMNPVRVLTAWNGVTDNVYYGYTQEVVPVISDVLNIDASWVSFDILALLNLGYLSGSNYADLVVTDGGADLALYYRLGEMPGTFSVSDSSGSGNNGSLVNGVAAPTFGVASNFLYDADTALDVSGGTNLPGGGISTIDNSTEPPTVHNPIGGTSNWTFECWFKWQDTTPQTTVTAFGLTILSAPNGDLMSGILPSGVRGSIQVGRAIGLNAFGLTQVSSQPSIIVTPGFTVPTWQASHAYGSGDEICPAATPEFVWIAFVGGTSSGTEPAWVNALNVTITDGGVTWISISNAGVVLTPTNNIVDGNWHYVWIEGSNTGQTQCVIDGVEITPSTTATIGHTLTDLTFGTGIHGFPGSLDEIAVTDTNAAGVDQAINHYNTGMWFQSVEVGASVGSANAGRFNKVLEVVGLDPSIMLEVPYPFRTELYAETNTVDTTSALNYMQTQSESEPGLIFQSGDGHLVAYSRQFQYLNERSQISQATISDDDTSPYFYDGPSLQITGDDLDLWNTVQVQSGRSGDLGLTSAESIAFNVGSSGAQLQQVTDQQSASVYGSRTLQGLTSLQMQNDADALAIAQNYLEWYKNPINRVTGMTLNSQGNGGANLPLMLGSTLYDRFTIKYAGQTPSSPFSQDSLVEQISHTVDMSQPTWITQFAMSGYEILLTPFILNNPIQGQLCGAASVTGGTDLWMIQPPTNPYASGTITLSIASGGSVTVPYNATALEIQVALNSITTFVTCTGGPINTNVVDVTFLGGESSFDVVFNPVTVLTL